MTSNKRIVLSSDHAGIQLRQIVAAHITAKCWEAVGIGPTASESTPYPKHGEAAAQLVASGDCGVGIVLCGTGKATMLWGERTQ